VLVPKQAPFTRENLDRRCLASRAFDSQVASIKADLGNDNLSTIETQLIENFAAISVAINAMTVDLLLGNPVDVIELSQLCSTSVRVGARLGLKRRARDVNQPHLADYLDGRQNDDVDELPGLPHASRPGREEPSDDQA
jgi:hypothetical protein